MYLSAALTEPEITPASHRRILVVDDDGAMRDLLADVLREEGYAVDVASDGEEACVALFLEPDGLSDYDLVVSDIRMPNFTGLELAEHVWRADGPPVVLVSAFVTLGVILDGLAVGALDVLPKPLDLQRLVALARAVAPPVP